MSIHVVLFLLKLFLGLSILVGLCLIVFSIVIKNGLVFLQGMSFSLAAIPYSLTFCFDAYGLAMRVAYLLGCLQIFLSCMSILFIYHVSRRSRELRTGCALC